jgi:hypothetical protein
MPPSLIHAVSGFRSHSTTPASADCSPSPGEPRPVRGLHSLAYLLAPRRSSSSGRAVERNAANHSFLCLPLSLPLPAPSRRSAPPRAGSVATDPLPPPRGLPDRPSCSGSTFQFHPFPVGHSTGRRSGRAAPAVTAARLATLPVPEAACGDRDRLLLVNSRRRTEFRRRIPSSGPVSSPRRPRLLRLAAVLDARRSNTGSAQQPKVWWQGATCKP